MISENSVPGTSVISFLYQNERFDNLKTRKSEVIKIGGKSVAGEKDGKCGKWILHVSYQLPVMFSMFSLLVYIKCFSEKMSVNATDMTYSKSVPVFMIRKKEILIYQKEK